MARTSARTARAASSGKPASAKRAAPPSTPSRQSKRIKSNDATPTNSTPKKSVYFEADGDTEEEEDDSQEEASASELADSGYEDEDASLTEPDEQSDDEYASSEDEQPSRRKSNGSAKATPKAASGKRSSGGELWREGVRSNLEPGEEVYIEIPKARPAGKIPYTDSRVHPNTMLFLGDLGANNERAWLKTHDADFRQSERDWKSYVEAVSEKLIDVDETIPELPVKDIVYRIYRDIRFSPDPTPYKPYFSAAWSRTGRKGPYAVYYLHIQPKGKSMVGGGLWMPDAGQLAKLRRHIDRKAHKLKAVLMQDGMRRSFLGGVAGDEKKVIRAFVAENKENALKKKPKDYEATHPEIELLKLRNFIVHHRLKDDEVTAKNSMETIASLMADLEPYITHLNSVVMPDGDSSDSDADDDDDDDEDDEDDIAADGDQLENGESGEDEEGGD